jgi:hypothetical protein
MARPMHSATSAELSKQNLTLVYFLRMDIESDPIQVYTGLGDYAFPAGSTGDTALDGLTFSGITHLVGEIGPVKDGQGGSGALDVQLPGVDLTDEAMRQVVYDRRRWQRRQAWLWMAFLNDSGLVVGNPIRLKTGRMDSMEVLEDDNGDTGTVKARIESQQSYAGEPLGTRYSEQEELDPADNSQRYVWQLANMSPAIGKANIIPGTAQLPSMGGSSWARAIATAEAQRKNLF